MWTGSFWTAAIERAFKTFFQTLAALIAGDGLGLADVAWRTSLSIAAMAALVSLFTSLGSEPFGQRGTPSLTRHPDSTYTPSHDLS